MRRKSGFTTIECEAEIDIDDYLDDASDNALLDEFANRNLLDKLDSQLDQDDLINLLVLKLDIIKSTELRELIENFLK